MEHKHRPTVDDAFNALILVHAQRAIAAIETQMQTARSRARLTKLQHRKLRWEQILKEGQAHAYKEIYGDNPKV